MADKVNDINIIEIGVNLSVVVEFCVENIIAVCFKHKGKEYRGVLLECKTGLFPGGIPFSSFSSTSKLASLKESYVTAQTNGSSFVNNNGPESCHPTNNNDDQRADVSSSVQRFSYNNDPYLTLQRTSSEITVVEMKPVGPRKKTIRDIRLRPRQTLCSNCKCAIHEGKKNRNPALPTPEKTVVSRSENVRSLRTRTSESYSTSLQTDQRKRRCPSSSPMVLLEDITHKSSKFNPFKDAKSDSDNKLKHGQKQNQEKNVDGDSSTSVDSFNCMPYKPKVATSKLSFQDGVLGNSRSLQAADTLDESSHSVLPKFKKYKAAANDFVTKRTPAIKISIGDGDVLKIPPRLPETFSSDNTSLSLEGKISDTKESQCHRKGKKSGRKSRDKDRHRSMAMNGDADNYTVNSKTQKKHKKKHRHRHQSPINNNNNIIPEQIVQNNNCNFVEIKEKPVQQLPTKIKVGDVFIDVVNISESESDRETCNDKSVKDENHENTLPSFDDMQSDRPRLVYTLKQDQGLSQVAAMPLQFPPEEPPCYLVKTSPSIVPMANSPHRRKNASPGRVVSASPSVQFSNSPSCLLKDYPLRSKTNGSVPGQPADLLSIAEHNVMHPSEDSQSHSSGLDSHISDSSEDSGEEQRLEDIFSNADSLSSHDQEDKDSIKPLMMKIQTQNVSGCLLEEEGREIHVGDIVWGKIQGFPWWPGRVSGITVTQRDNDVVITQLAKVAWFGSNTMSHVRCCDLFPFLEDFKLRYNKKKKGQYRQAIKQATIAARRFHAESTVDILEYVDD